MAKILYIIGDSSFEVVRTQIAAILAEEIANQVVLLNDVNEGDGDNINAAVFIERVVSIDESELPLINVSLLGGNYSNKDQTQTDGTYQFAIDVYVGSAADGDSQSDQLSRIKLSRILAICRAILENPGYRTLNMSPPFNCNTSVVSINPMEMSPNTDQQSISMGRLILSVRVPEYVELKESEPISSYQTKVKLFLTNKGYQYGPNAN